VRGLAARRANNWLDIGGPFPIWRKRQLHHPLTRTFTASIRAFGMSWLRLRVMQNF